MTGEVQNNTNPIVQARFIRKSDAKELDKIREDYVSLMDEARALEAKGKSEKAEKKRNLAEGAMLVYEQKAKELGLSVTTVQEAAAAVDAYNGEPLVTPGTKLTKAEKKEVEALEKEIKKYQKKLGKFSKEEIHRANSTTTASELTKDQKEILYYQQELGKVQAQYAETCDRLGIPSAADIIKRVYSIEDPTKASKIRDIVKKELKDANMYFGLTKDALKADEMDNVLDALAIRNEVRSNIEKGYVGTKKKLVERYKNEDAAEVAAEYAQAAGGDLTFNRRSNEREITQRSQNVEYFNEPFIEANKGNGLTEFNTITLDGKEINTSDITRITTLAGGVLTSNDGFEGVKLGDIRTIETKDGQYSFQPIYKEKGDENYLKRRDTKRLGKDMGYKYDKIKWGKAIADTVLGTIPAGVTAALLPFKVAFNDNLRVSINVENGSITSDALNQLYQEFLQKAQEQGADVNLKELGEITSLELIKETHFEKTHYCVAPAIANAAAVFIGSMLEQVYRKEEIVPEKAYNAAREKLTLEMKHNVSGGDGYILNQKELDKAMFDVIALAKEVIDTPVNTTGEPAQESQPAQPAKPTPNQTPTRFATITTTDVAPQVKEAEDCLYNNKPGEHWDGIIRLGYVDANGNAITNEKDIAELRNLTKRTINGFAASSADMPEGVKLRKTYTCKSGNTYTWNLCGDDPDAKLRDKYTSKEAAKDANGNPIASRRIAPKVGMESTQSTMTPGRYSWSWSDNNNRYEFGGMSFDNPADRDASMEAEREALIKGGYIVK